MRRLIKGGDDGRRLNKIQGGWPRKEGWEGKGGHISATNCGIAHWLHQTVNVIPALPRNFLRGHWGARRLRLGRCGWGLRLGPWDRYCRLSSRRRLGDGGGTVEAGTPRGGTSEGQGRDRARRLRARVRYW